MERILRDLTGPEPTVSSEREEATWSRSWLCGGGGGNTDDAGGGCSPSHTELRSVEEPDWERAGEEDERSTMPEAIDAVREAATSISGTLRPR